MGFTPAEFYAMSIWEFAAAIDGWNRAHGDGRPAPPTDDEFDAMWAREAEIFGTVH
jgi:hypothetical protein